MVFHKNKEFYFLIIAFFILIIKYGLQYISPFTNTDGPWTLSPAISYLNGNYNASTFSHDYLGEVFTVHVFQVISAPFFYFFGVSTNSLFAFNLVLIFISSVIIYCLVKSSKSGLLKFLVFTFVIILNMYLLNFRVETIGVLFGLLIILIQQRIIRKNIRLVLFAIILGCSGLIHPIMGVGNGLLALYILIKNLYKLRDYFFLFIGTIVCLFVFSEGNILSFLSNVYGNSIEVANHTFSITLIFKYIFYNPILLFIFYIIYKNYKLDIFYIILAIIILSFFGRSYYFSYLIPIAILIIINEDRKIVLYSVEKMILIILVLIGFFWSYILPFGVYVENPKYGNTMRMILNKSKLILNEMDKSGYLWVPSQIGMEVMDNKNSRMYFHSYKTISTEKINLGEGDKLLIYELSDLKNIYKNLGPSKEELLIEEIIKPVKGKLKMSELFKKRSDSIGLWSIQLKRKQEK